MHEKTIVHIDIDCFYAQCEELEAPELRDKPMGIQQKTCLVTSNYAARKYGITKLMYVPDALKLCPDLILVNGEDLTKYKKMSDQIFGVIQKFVTYVEKLGLDENYIDVSEIVEERMKENLNSEIQKDTFTLENSEEDEDECDCGCQKRLVIGTHIAREIRQSLFDELGITSCAGIAHNKLLAKLVGSRNKPNKQTVIFPHQVSNFLNSLGPVRTLCGIGSKTAEALDGIGVRTIRDLQNIEISMLKRKFDEKTSERLKELAFGIDKSEVKPTTKQKTISIEDSTFSNPLKTVLEVETKLNVLLTRLVDAAIIDQKRIPTTLRVVIRKTTNIKELLQRESRQKDIPSSWFSKNLDPVHIVTLLHPIAIQLFRGIMNNETHTQFKITLVGVSFTKFLDTPTKDSNAILKFLKPVSENKNSNEIRSIKRKEELEDSDKSEPLTKKHKKGDLTHFLEKTKPSNTNIEAESSSSDQKASIKFEIPKDMDTKAFNRLPVSEKKRIMNELKSAVNPSLIDYPRKEKLERNKMDAYVFKY